VLPYTQIFQSGVLFLAYSFGLPVIAADVGSLKEDIIEGRTGLVFEPENADDLARALRRYFEGDLFASLEDRRVQIRSHAQTRHSWETVAQMTKATYGQLINGSTDQHIQ
jgi:glycosyltransferase involved in cell wall biosynthesis